MKHQIVSSVEFAKTLVELGIIEEDNNVISVNIYAQVHEPVIVTIESFLKKPIGRELELFKTTYKLTKVED